MNLHNIQTETPLLRWLREEFSALVWKHENNKYYFCTRRDPTRWRLLISGDAEFYERRMGRPRQ